MFEAEIFKRLAAIPDIRALKLDDRGSREITFSVMADNPFNTAFNNGNNALTIAPALGAAPAVGTNFNVLANSISGTGTSTFRVSNVSTVLNGNPAVGTENLFTNIISNFGSTVNLIDGAGGNQDDNPNAGIFGG